MDVCDEKRQCTVVRIGKVAKILDQRSSTTISLSVINTEEYLTKEPRVYLEENGCRVRDRVLEPLTEDEF